MPERTPGATGGANVDLNRLAGRLIVEGADGSGRSTQIAMLTGWKAAARHRQVDL